MGSQDSPAISRPCCLRNQAPRYGERAHLAPPDVSASPCHALEKPKVPLAPPAMAVVSCFLPVLPRQFASPLHQVNPWDSLTRVTAKVYRPHVLWKLKLPVPVLC